MFRLGPTDVGSDFGVASSIRHLRANCRSSNAADRSSFAITDSVDLVSKNTDLRLAGVRKLKRLIRGGEVWNVFATDV